MNSRPVTPSIQRQRALEALLAGATVQDAATGAGIARETLSRWLHHDAGFQAELEALRAESWHATRDRLRCLVPKAIRTLDEAMDAPTPTTRLRAASLVLRTAGMLGEPPPTAAETKPKNGHTVIRGSVASPAPGNGLSVYEDADCADMLMWEGETAQRWLREHGHPPDWRPTRKAETSL